MPGTAIDSSTPVTVDDSEEVPEELETAEAAIHPDDMPWEPPEENAGEVTIMSTSGTARTTVAEKAPPPLLRRVKTEDLSGIDRMELERA